MKWPEGSVYSIFLSSLGDLYLVACDQGLCALLWPEDLKDSSLKDSLLALRRDDFHPFLIQASEQLKEYFSGTRQDFDLPLVTLGTEFQKLAWRELSRIPYGQTISYREQALRLGDAKKARAVGTANGKNLLCIVIPCHRVITTFGELGGYRGGLENKRRLLELEQSARPLS